MKIVLLALSLVAGCDAFAADAKEFDSRRTRQKVAQQLDEGELPELARNALDAMFHKAAVELKKKGRADLAADLKSEWNTFGQDLLNMSMLKDVGDHDPFSEWLAAWYAKLEAVLGVQIMEMTHLRDIWVMNFTIPVIFHPEADSAWCKAVPAPDTCQAEYRRHMAGTKWQKKADEHADEIQHHGFAGVVTYWAVDVACMAAGGGLACGPVGTAAEFVMERYFAPSISDRIFTRVNAAVAAEGCECGDECQCESCECDSCATEDLDHA